MTHCIRGTLSLACYFAVVLPATAQMQYPLDVAAAPDGILYIADRNLPGIWKMEGGKLVAYFTGSKQFRTPLNAVRCVAIDREGRLLAGDSSTREVYRFGADGQPVALTGGGIGIPMGIAVTASGDLLVSDLELHRIWKVPGQGGKPAVLAEVPAPRGVRLDDQQRLWVVSHGKESQLVRVAPDGVVTAVVNGRPFEFPHDVVLSPDGTAYVSDGYGRAVWRLASGGKPEKWFSGEPLLNPVGLEVSGSNLLVVDPRVNAVFQIDPAGKIQRVTPKEGG